MAHVGKFRYTDNLRKIVTISGFHIYNKPTCKSLAQLKLRIKTTSQINKLAHS